MRGRRVAIAAAVGMVLISAMPPVGAQADRVADTLMWLGASAEDAATVAAAKTLDGIGDTFRFAVPGSTPATIDGPYGDIVSHVGMAARFEAFGPDDVVSVPCDTMTDDGALVLCDRSEVSLEGEWWVFTAEMGGEIPIGPDGLYHSYAFPILTATGIPWEPQGDFLWDTYQGTDLWFEASRTPDTEWTLEVTDSDAGFGSTPVGSFVVIRGSTFTLAVPAPALGYDFPAVEASTADMGATPEFAVYNPNSGADGMDALGLAMRPCYGVHQHSHDGTFGATGSDLSIVDSSPDTNTDERRTAGDLACVGPETVAFGGDEPPPASSTTTTTLATVASTAAPTTTIAATPSTAAPTDEGGSGTGPLILVFIGILVILLWLFLGTDLFGGGTERPGEDDEEDDEDVRDAPTPVVYGEEIGHGRYAYVLELRHWRAWTDLIGYLTAYIEETFSEFDFDKDPWLCAYESPVETFIAIRGEPLGRPGMESFSGVVRLGSSVDKNDKKYTSRFKLTRKGMAVPKGQRSKLGERYAAKKQAWADSLQLTGWLRNEKTRNRWINKSYTRTDPNVEYQHLALDGRWPLGAPTPYRQHFKVLAIWSVFVEKPPEQSAWDKYATTVGDLIKEELKARAEGVIKAKGGKLGELAVGAAKKITEEATKGNEDEQQLAGAVMVPWIDLPNSWLPILLAYPQSPEKADYGTGPEAWSQVRRKNHSRATLSKKQESRYGGIGYSPTRWELFLDNMDFRLHVDESQIPGTPPPKNT